jgi:hypothetical protein
MGVAGSFETARPAPGGGDDDDDEVRALLGLVVQRRAPYGLHRA